MRRIEIVAVTIIALFAFSLPAQAIKFGNSGKTQKADKPEVASDWEDRDWSKWNTWNGGRDVEQDKNEDLIKNALDRLRDKTKGDPVIVSIDPRPGSAVPEPTAALAFAVGFAVVGGARRVRKR